MTKETLDIYLQYLLFWIIVALLIFMLFTGCAGPRGEVGATGPQGAIGSPGQDATPVTMVQFCPGYTGAYNNFPEFGMNVGGKLYAVYSTADLSFLTRLYPGAYRTTTNATNCNFTVNADGSLSY